MREWLRGILVLTASLALGAARADAAISVGPRGAGPLEFESLPTQAEGWTTFGVPGSSGDLTVRAALDAVVQLRSFADFTSAPASSATVNPAPTVHALACWNSTGHYLQLRPGGVAATLLLATLQNDTGYDLSTVTLAYDFGTLVARGAVIAEEVPGLVAYFSLTGMAGSWQAIPELSTSAPARLTAEPDLGSWPSGAWLFVLWADDNSVANADGTGPEEGAYTLDNFVVWPGPRLFISRVAGTQLELAWRFPSTGFELQSNSNLTTAAWQRVTNASRPNDGFQRVTVDTASGAAFFRLERR